MTTMCNPVKIENFYTTSQARKKFNIEPKDNPNLVLVDLNKKNQNIAPQELHEQLDEFRKIHRNNDSVCCWKLI